MDSETRQAINQLLGRINRVNESLDTTTEALGQFIEECNGRFSGIDEILEILINETTVGRKRIMDELEAINRRLDE
ncbi:hypothetical protein IQ260_22895 [Leptolyngbya cf. ectocarpi LEGE 11479]|uniref:Uncharacterized protein n=1 Tax=Leptolyngbya cf. ectocarpi LEGE 11479 TaxID=1828722 RepID=A0A928ZY27_LEPEC|nr:hypothetical protein [Leptolyngbya ectocarpi]MBE9069498.1 hypothetical protein [Leptolyngbya cf. ectocarpi LEGE 11479]